MRNKIILIILFVLCVNSAQARIFFVGSLPFLSIIAYPQDLNEFDTEYASISASYQKLPWWGDIDEATLRPNDSYSSTAENITFVRDENDTETSYFENYGSGLEYNVELALFKKWKNVKNLITLSYEVFQLKSTVDANLKVDETTPIYIPVDYLAMHLIGDFNLETILAGEIADIPVGLKLSVGRENTLELENHMNFKLNGTNFQSERLLWGWSTSGCNHIFGYSHVSADAWLQREYSTGPIMQYDVQLGVTLPKWKIGTRLRILNGVQDQYIWQAEGTNTVLQENFMGSYEQQTWSKKSDNLIYRLYANYTWTETKYYKLNTLLFFGYDQFTGYNALSENLEVEQNSTEGYKNFIIEVNPNVNFFLGEHFTIDAAILLEYSRNRFENRYDRYNSLIGGSKSTYWNSSAYIGPEYSWENFSYAVENFYDVGLDISMLMPLYGNATTQLGFLAIIFVNSKFTDMNKYYGTNANTSSDIDFHEVSVRDNYKREIWFNTALGLYFKKNRVTVRLEFLEPLIYSLFSRTQVKPYESSEILYENEKYLNWAVQEGTEIKLTLQYDI